MKLFKKFLSTMISVGMLFSAASLYVFATPTNLDECCAELDRILSSEEKAAIKTSLVDNPSSYLYRANIGKLGNMIIKEWLYLPVDVDGGAGSVGGTLAELLLSHGVGFDGSMELDRIMSGVIIDCYRHYLKGEKIPTIEDLAIDHWFRCFSRFGNPRVKREILQKDLEREKKLRVSRKNKNSQCSIM